MNDTRILSKDAQNFIHLPLPDPRKVTCTWWSDEANVILLYFLSKGLRKEKEYLTRKADIQRYFQQRSYKFSATAINCQIARFCIYRDSVAYYGDGRVLDTVCELESMAPAVTDETGKEFNRVVFNGIRNCISKYRNDPIFKIDTGDYKIPVIDGPALYEETLKDGNIQEKIAVVCQACPYIRFRSYEAIYNSPLPDEENNQN